ncbi:MAG TPA: hypothetical protein VIS99_15655 [Terrimicrobiaceae bacterium]
MKETYLLGRLVLLACLTSAPQLVANTILSELNASQKSQIQEGAQVVIIEDVEGKPWPRIKVYRFINASPEQVAAVFFNFEDAKTYVPNIFKSEVSKRISPCTMDVDYGLNVPIFPDELYTVRNSLRVIDENTYCIDWKLLRAVLTKDSVGSFRVEAWDGKSLVRYDNLVTPASNIAMLLRKKAIEQMKDTSEAFAVQVEKEKSSNPPGLKRQVAALRAAIKEETGTQLTKY